MKNLSRVVSLLLASTLLPSLSYAQEGTAPDSRVPNSQVGQPKLPVDIVFCVDGSGSMDGDMSQAKELMRGVVQQFAHGPLPTDLRIGFIEYGNQDEDYKVMPLTANANQVYSALEVITTDMGASEWVGRVIQKADQEMRWRPLQNTFRAIYVLGNETAAQGEVDYHESVPQAVADGIVVNAVQCERTGGAGGVWGAQAAQTWQEIAALGGGSYFHYRLKGFTDTTVGLPSAEDIHKVQEEQLAKARLLLALRDQERARIEKFVALNDTDSTLLNYGPMATFWSGYRLMYAVNKNLNGSSLFAATLPSKLNTLQSDKSSWDLVDASRLPDFDISRVRSEQLPFEMRSMNTAQKLQYIQRKAMQRVQLATIAGVTL